MEAGTKSLSETLASAKQFVIPEYQRPYVWSKEEVEQLWDDLYGSYSEKAQKADDEQEAEVYFLGPIVVANRDDSEGAKIAHVVDGQQRLTTLSALLWIMALHLNGGSDSGAAEGHVELERLLTLANGQASFRVARADQANYQAIRKGDVLDERMPLGVTGTYLRTEVAKLDTGTCLALKNFILHRTRFVLVQTESFASAWELFIGLNGKGRPLNPADLIKAFVCGTHEDSKAMSEIWEEKILPLENDATSALLDTWRVATGGRGSDATLFKLFEKAWRQQDLGSSLLSSGAESYHRFWIKPLEKLTSLENQVQRALRALRRLRRRDVSPVIIALGSCFGFEAIFRKRLVVALEAYQLWMAITGKRGREAKFSSLANKIHSDGMTEQEAMCAVRDELAQLAPSREHVHKAVAESAYKGRVMLFIVQSFEEGMRGDVRIDDVWYEHIMPQTPTEYWFAAANTDDPNTYSRLVNNIGNITPLDPATNIKGSNAPWDVKRELYMTEVPNWLAAQIAREHEDGWTPHDIRNRSETIADWAVNDRWNLTRALEGIN